MKIKMCRDRVTAFYHFTHWWHQVAAKCNCWRYEITVVDLSACIVSCSTAVFKLLIDFFIFFLQYITHAFILKSKVSIAEKSN